MGILGWRRVYEGPCLVLKLNMADLAIVSLDHAISIML